MKFLSRIVSLVLTIFLFIGVFSATANAASRQEVLGVAFVTASALRLRSGAGTNTATLDYAEHDEVVVLLERIGDWYKVNYNLQIGFMHKNYLRTATRENAELGYGRVNGSGVNVRSGPGTGYSSMAKAYTGDSAYIIGINAGWYKVIFQSAIGYIRSDYLDLTEVPYENSASKNTPKFFKGGNSTGTEVSAAALGGTTGSSSSSSSQTSSSSSSST